MQIATRHRRVFLAKALTITALVVAAGSYAADRYTFGFDPAEYRCLADYRSFIVDSHADIAELERGVLVAFESQGLAPFFEDGQKVTKWLAGVPGDRVAVRALDSGEYGVFVNDELQATGLRYVDQLGVAPTEMVGEMTVPPGEYWVMGDTPYSFDSRYWGTIREAQIVGRSYGLL
nr:signal peptidase I [uncultured Halomonas sp.]